MTDAEIQDFVTRFAAAWAVRDGHAFVELWHPEGLLHTPLVGRTVAGGELNRLMEVQTAAAPDFVWQLLDWTARGNVVIIEWQTTRIVNGARFDWRGVVMDETGGLSPLPQGEVGSHRQMRSG